MKKSLAIMITMAATLSSGFIVLENTRAIAGDTNFEERVDDPATACGSSR